MSSIVINEGDSMELLKTGSVDPLLHPAEVARMLKVSLSWLAKARLTGAGPAYVKVGRNVRYRLGAVQDYIKVRTRASTKEA
jgi:hypothetical protein